MQKDILFDNIYIGHSIEDAKALKAETFDVKIIAEKEEEEATRPKTPEKPKSPSDLKFMDDPVHFIREKIDLFIAIAQRDPIQAIQFVPEVSGAIGVIIALLVTVLFVSLSRSGSAPSKQDVKAAAKKTADKAAEAVTTATDTAKEEVTKRTTRSSDKSS